MNYRPWLSFVGFITILLFSTHNRGILPGYHTAADSMPPTAVCHGVLEVQLDILPNYPNGAKWIHASELDNGSFDNDSALTFKIAQYFPCEDSITNYGDSILFAPISGSCYQYFLLKVIDESGHSDSCITSIKAASQCNIIISPGIETSHGSQIDHFNFTVVGQKFKYQYPFLQLLDVVDSDSPVCISKTDAPLYGVSTFDIILLRKHLLGQDLFDSPSTFLSADVNLDNKVTTLDIIFIRSLLLGHTTEFPAGISWRFIPDDYPFPAPNPLSDDIPDICEMYTLCDWLEGIPVNLVGVKLGDVSGSVH